MSGLLTGSGTLVDDLIVDRIVFVQHDLAHDPNPAHELSRTLHTPGVPRLGVIPLELAVRRVALGTGLCPRTAQDGTLRRAVSRVLDGLPRLD